MNTFILLPRVALLLAGLFLLALPGRAVAPESAATSAIPSVPMADNAKGHTTHTITITYDAAANPQWRYAISPENDAKNARVKRHDTILWKCDGGEWTVFFKGPTPLANPSGEDLARVTGAAGISAGGKVDGKVKKGEEFVYGVSVLLPGASEPVVDDPRIIIQN